VYGKLKVNTFTDKDQVGKSKFNGFVEVLDADGNKVNVRGIPNNIPIDQFMDVWTNIFVPKATSRYQTKKQEESQLQE